LPSSGLLREDEKGLTAHRLSGPVDGKEG